MSIQIAVVGFSLFMPMLLYAVAFFAPSFMKSPTNEKTVRFALGLFATYLLILSATIVADLATQAGVGLQTEIFQYVNILEIVGSVGIAVGIILAALSYFRGKKEEKENERMGYGEA